MGKGANARTAGVSSWAKEFSFVGNVMGRPGQMSGWRYADRMMGCDVNGSNCVGGVSGAWGQGVRVTDGVIRRMIDKWLKAGVANGNIWQVAYDATNQWTQQAEPGALSTIIRDGNYDFLTNSQRWHNTPGGFTIPSSMYLTAKPAFFGSNRWPWVDPTTGTIYTLPAKARYDAGTPNNVTRTIATNTHDFNGDGKSDILWQDTSGSGRMALWLMNSAQILQNVGDANVPSPWSIV